LTSFLSGFPGCFTGGCSKEREVSEEFTAAVVTFTLLADDVVLAYNLGDTDPLRVLPSEGDAALDLAAEGVVLLVGLAADDGLGMMMACCAVVLFTVEAALMGDRPTDEKGAADV